MFEQRSPLATHLAAGGRDGAGGGRGLRIGEVRGFQLLQIGVLRGSGAALGAAIEAACGCAPPDSARLVSVCGAHRLYRIAADQFWIASADPQLPPALERLVTPQLGTLTVLTHARIRLAIEGAAAAALLAKLVTVDLRPKALPVGAFAQTAVHHAGVLLEHGGVQRYELYVLHTYAASTWDWILDAAMPYGYDLHVAHIAQQPGVQQRS
ncbi:MAG TPA: sarcosine oxidase subunit gamma family protein [Steroidobacteraceae bacterium]|nr:sarcosine oxidase subunit gamma family protein [Steroidobacteraceae bacterium]